LTVILNASRKFRNAHEISASGETVGRRTLAERVQPWLAPAARLLLLPFNVAIAVARVATVLAVAVGLVLLALPLLLGLALLLLVRACWRGAAASRRTGDNTPLQTTEDKGGGNEFSIRNHGPGPGAQ